MPHKHDTETFTIPLDQNADERPVAVFTSVFDVSRETPALISFVIHRSSRDALCDIREKRYEMQRICNHPNTISDLSDFVFDAVVILPDQSLRMLKRTRNLFHAGGDLHDLFPYEYTEIFAEMKERIDDWVEMGGDALCLHALESQIRSQRS